MALQREHSLNGFIFTHNLNSFGGRWVREWYFKPKDAKEWCPYYLPSVTVKKNDVVEFLKNTEEAKNYYDTWLLSASDIEAAERRLQLAQQRVEKVTDPNWDYRGNNPNKESRIIKNAISELSSAKVFLENAKALKKRLSNQ
ncbi:hypothetical protein G3341_06515 [Providencia vermicola]|uniref:hypothetical protein n=1 Tax=Providencia vermicola TaxID=333965 RepID=UPI0013A70F78|nr:hypothetical protein [Providencia vermicola]QIC15382.1 hypothetical protein G3341_06515 [Providencia vermicola]